MSLLNTADRSRGILTAEDRHYLFGDLDMSSYSDPNNAIKQRRFRIRTRMEHALLDLVVANNLLSGRDQARVFDSLRESMKREQFEHVVSELFDFLFANMPVGHRRSSAALGISKALHRTSLEGSGGTFNIRPTVEIQTTNQVDPNEFDHKAHIARYQADLERTNESQPPNIAPPSEIPEDPSERGKGFDPYASPIENRGFDLEESDHDNRDKIYEQRINFLDLLDQWQV